MDHQILKLVDVCTYYGTTQVLHKVSLEVKQGSIVALLGRNGMGKTTTVHSIIGFTSPKSGSVDFKGERITCLRPYQIAQMGLAIVPQGRRIFASLSVEENLTMGARRMEYRDYSLERIYSLFPVLEARKRFRANTLSGGEQQMLSFGRALMTNPDLLLMDEPSEGLAPLIVKELGRIMTQLVGEGISILLVEQNLQLVFDVSEYVYIISKGSIVYDSTIEKLRSDEEAQNNYLFVAESPPHLSQ
jgi:branched-chain amino acid transport system ATP-binding protein